MMNELRRIGSSQPRLIQILNTPTKQHIMSKVGPNSNMPLQMQSQSLVNFHARPPFQQKLQLVALPETQLKLTFVKASGSCSSSPFKSVVPKSFAPKIDRKRSESLDMARIVTKESTVLLQDIYNNIQSTLKKYDGIVKDRTENKMKNDSVKNSMVKSMTSSIKKSSQDQFENLNNSKTVTNKPLQQNPTYQMAYDAQIVTLKQQQQLLLLMFQNNTVQEQIMIQNQQSQSHRQTLTEILPDEDEQKQISQISSQISKFKMIQRHNTQHKLSKFIQHSDQSSEQKATPPSQKQITSESKVHICNQEECQMNLPQSIGQEIKDLTQNLTIRNSDNQTPKPQYQTFKSKPKEEIQIQLKRKRRRSQSTNQKIDNSSVLTSPQQSNYFNVQKQKYFFVEQDEVQSRFAASTATMKRQPSQQQNLTHGYSQIHKKRVQSPDPRTEIRLSMTPRDFSQRNLIWKKKIVDRIKVQQEVKKNEEMKLCTFKPSIKTREQLRNSIPKLQQSKILKTESTNSELHRDLKEIVSILDEFSEFQQFIAGSLPIKQV